MSKEYLVRDFMTSPAASIPHHATLLDAALAFRRTNFRHLPVVDGGRVVGVISSHDVQRLAPSLLTKISPDEYNKVFENTPLAGVMTRNPATVTPTTPLRDAATWMNQKKVGCLPVVLNDQLVGIITVIDMLDVLLQFLNVAQVSPVEGR